LATPANKTSEVEDGLEEIDPSNIMPSRTRGAKIDFAKAAAENPADEDDDEEEDDDYIGGEEGQGASGVATSSDDKMDED
jgi:hypothetical protein